MHRNRIRSTAFASLVLAACIAAAPVSGPATRPTSRPTPPPPPALTAKDSIELKAEKAKLSFRVPKTWEKLDATSAGGDAEAFTYGPPSPNAGHANPNAAPAPVAPTRQVQVVLGKPCTPPEQTLDDLVTTLRTESTTDAAHPVTFTRDAAETIAGQPGWRLDYPFETTMTVTTTSRGKTNTHEVKVKNFKRIDVWIRDGSYNEIAFTYDMQAAQTMERAADQIVASFADSE